MKLTLDQLEEATVQYRADLYKEIDVGGLYSRNNVAHKWKVTYRTILLRELVSWRFVDLLQQAIILEKYGKFVGSRILIRSAIETLSLLLYSIRKMEEIVRTGNGCHEYSLKTENLLLGSKDDRTKHDAVHVLSVLRIAADIYPELMSAYDDLSETVHPNYDGLLSTYSDDSNDGMLTTFTDDSSRIYKNSQLALITLLCIIFEVEYNNAWTTAFEKFEGWISKNDTKLEETK